MKSPPNSAAAKTIDVLANDNSTAGPTLTITHINGTAVSSNPSSGLPSSVTLATGQVVTLNSNGTLTVDADTDAETVYFNYTIEDQTGNSDTALVEFEQRAPCFTAGTVIRTDTGDRAVEDLRPGMLLKTMDDGFQPIQWIGRSQLAPSLNTLPIRIKAGVLENRSDLVVSPQHRVLLRGARAELLFGCDEVLVSAKDLLNDRDVLRDHTDQTIIYYHILMPEHALLYSDGQWSESFLPGPMTRDCFDPFANWTLRAVLANRPKACYDMSVRPSLRSYEATALLAA